MTTVSLQKEDGCAAKSARDADEEAELRRTADQVTRFVQLALRGGRCGASGEITCRALALALHKIGDDVMLLDEDAIEGFCATLRMMVGPFSTYDQKEKVYNMVRRAAGK